MKREKFRELFAPVARDYITACFGREFGTVEFADGGNTIVLSNEDESGDISMVTTDLGSILDEFLHSSCKNGDKCLSNIGYAMTKLATVICARCLLLKAMATMDGDNIVRVRRALGYDVSTNSASPEADHDD